MDYTPSPQEYLTQNFSVIPLRLDGSKAPAITWKPYQEQRATDAELDQWFSHSESGIGVVAGKISSNLLVIDFDYDAEKVFSQFWSDIQLECPDITDKFVIVQTPRPGIQVWLRQDSPVGPNQILAYTEPRLTVGNSPEATDGADTPRLEPQVMIESRGDGGYVVAPGSPVSVHQNGTPYQIIHGNLSCLSPLTVQESERVLALCRSYTRFTPQNVQRQPGEKYSGVPRPGDVFNDNADLQQLLLDHGWTIDRTNDDGVIHLKRPGKSAPGSSATLGYIKDDDGRPLFFVFSSNASPFQQDQCYDAFAVFALTEHDGDYSNAAAAARALYRTEVEHAQAAYGQAQKNELQLLCEQEAPYKPFPLDCLPETVKAYASESAGAIGIDEAFVAVPILPVLAAAIGGSRSIRLKPGWDEPSIIWTITVGGVSSGKTPGFEAAKKPIVDVENSLHLVRLGKAKQFDHQMAIYEQAKADGEKGVVKPKKQEDRRQVLLNDLTMEALADVAAENDKLLCAIDEVASFVKQMDQYRPGRDKENWLSMYDGGGLNINRKKDNLRIWVPRTHISMTGTTQPAVAASVIYTEEFLNNGLAARILSARPPSAIVRWTEQEVNPSIDEAMRMLVMRCYLLKGGSDDFGPCPKVLTCSDEAKQLFIQWMDDTADYAESMAETLKNSWLKLRPVAARLALILSVTRQLMELPEGQAMQPVDAQSMQAGIELASWFGYELERNAAGSELKALHDHLAWILGKHPGGVDGRLLQMGRRGIRTADEARRVLNDLAAREFGQIVGNRFVPTI